ncbi:MAG: hypothetical protein ABFS14_10850 [Gemmatimonadota bacterium]
MTKVEPGSQGDPPQLHIWEGTSGGTQIGTLVDDSDAIWNLFVLVERTGPDLCKGRLSYRRGDERLDTGSVIVEDTVEAVISRAAELPASMLRQFLAAVREV